MNPLKDSLGLIVIVIAVLIIFGPNQLPKLAKMFGKTMRSARDAMEGKVQDDELEAAPVAAVASETEPKSAES